MKKIVSLQNELRSLPWRSKAPDIIFITEIKALPVNLVRN